MVMWDVVESCDGVFEMDSAVPLTTQLLVNSFEHTMHNFVHGSACQACNNYKEKRKSTL